MMVKHRGYEIVATREQSLGGWKEIYWSAFRVRDGFELTSGFGEHATVREAIGFMKCWVDVLVGEFRGRLACRDRACDIAVERFYSRSERPQGTGAAGAPLEVAAQPGKERV